MTATEQDRPWLLLFNKTTIIFHMDEFHKYEEIMLTSKKILVYVDMGNQATDTVTLAFTFSTSSSTTRNWEIKVSQISCNNPAR